MTVSASIVLFKNHFSEIDTIVRCLQTIDYLYIVDNSPNDDLSTLTNFKNVKYMHNPSNPGFGAAHNIAIEKAIAMDSKYHFIVNPDVYFQGDVISTMVNYLNQNSDVGMLMPQILNEDGSVQNLPKLLPSPYTILMRKIKKPASIYNRFIDEYELRSVSENKIYNAPILSGCFTLLRLEAIKQVGMYDDHFFMYFEDWDLSRRMHQKYKTVYYPEVSIIHGYESGANKNPRLFKIYIRSAITYFNKWGWFFDINRKKINKKALAQFNK